MATVDSSTGSHTRTSRGGGSGGGGSGGGGKRPLQPPGRAHEKSASNTPSVQLPKITKVFIRDRIESDMTDAEASIAGYPLNDQIQLLWRPSGAAGRYAIERGRQSTYRRALLAHIRGREAQSVHQKDCGHFNMRGVQQCVVFNEASNHLQGACTNCAFGGHCNRCNFFNGPPPQTAATPSRSSSAPRSSRSGAVSPTSSQRTIGGSLKPHTIFNPGINTKSSRALEAQAENLERQARSNRERAEDLRKRRDIRSWSNDFNTTSEGAFEGVDDDKMEQ